MWIVMRRPKCIRPNKGNWIHQQAWCKVLNGTECLLCNTPAGNGVETAGDDKYGEVSRRCRSAV